MIFTIFRDFSGFFRIYFRFELIKINKKMAKTVYICAGPCGCDVALGAMWQRHADPRGAYAAYIYLVLYYIFYIVEVFSLP